MSLKKIQNLIGKSKIDQAIELLKVYAVGESYEELMLTVGRWNSVNKKMRLGVIDNRDANTEISRIVQNLLYLANQICGEDEDTPVTYIGEPLPNKVVSTLDIDFLKKNFIGSRQEIQDILNFAVKFLGFFRSNLTEDEYDQYCGEAEDAYNKLKRRDTDWNRAVTLLAEMAKLAPDYMELIKLSSQENDLERLYNNLIEAPTFDNLALYMQEVNRKYSGRLTRDRDAAIYDEVQWKNTYSTATPIAAAAAQKKVVQSWIGKIGKIL